MLSRWTHVITILLLVIVLPGCATYSAGLEPVFADLKKGNFQDSEDQLKKALSPDGADGLLYYLELGVIRHLDGNYIASNRAFEEAERLAEQLETTSLINATLSMFSNARQANYAGQSHEKLLINYYKALNYLGIAEQATDNNARLDALEGSRVEARRLIMKLNDLNDRIGTYQQRNDDADSTYNRILQLFNALSGDVIDENKLTYRDDAMAHYLTGLSFEMNGEYDDARISYQKSAESYQQGYAEQFRLGQDITAQAWFDTARMMKLAGGYDSELSKLKADKLTADQRQQLDQVSRKDAQLLVIEHKGFAPPLEELNVQLWADPKTRTLKLQPLAGNNRDAWAWFYLLYADKGAYNVLMAYLDGRSGNFPFTPFQKTIYLGPLWSEVESLNLDTAIGSFLRVAVPYYKPPTRLGASTLEIDSGEGPADMTLYPAASPAQMGIQQRLVNSSSDIQIAMARAALKSLSVKAVTGSDSTGLLSLAGGLLSQLSEASETRSWQLLPSDIRIRRLTLPAGEHKLSLTSELEPGITEHHQTTVNLQAGEIALWQVRSMGKTPTTDY